jgi:hypothetical protein
MGRSRGTGEEGRGKGGDWGEEGRERLITPLSFSTEKPEHICTKINITALFFLTN